MGRILLRMQLLKWDTAGESFPVNGVTEIPRTLCSSIFVFEWRCKWRQNNFYCMNYYDNYGNAVAVSTLLPA